MIVISLRKLRFSILFAFALFITISLYYESLDYYNSESSEQNCNNEYSLGTTTPMTKTNNEHLYDKIFPSVTEIQDKCYHCPGNKNFMGFIGSPNSTIITLPIDQEEEEEHNLPVKAINSCTCQLLSIDCLDSIDCLPSNQWKPIIQAIQTRISIKQQAQYWDHHLSIFDTKPVGMTTQFVTVWVFRYWLAYNQLPKGYPNSNDLFIDSTNDTVCTNSGHHKLIGRRCYLHDFHQFETYGDLEYKAMEHTQHTPSFIQNNNNYDVSWIHQLQQNPLEASPSQYLIAFGILSRIVFSPRPNIIQLYQQRLVTIDHYPPTNQNNARNKQQMAVALHMRRGDACRHETTGYKNAADPIHSEFQTSSNRKCYATKVYIKALKRVIKKLKRTHHIIVYLATDASDSIIDEMRSDFPDQFKAVSWKYLNYSRKLFNYYEGRIEENQGDLFIESTGNSNKLVLGEAALLDIHHLSHGAIFIGHLGSRFGKLSWWQAIGRRGTFVPFFTVDGHGTCCDIDESCGMVAPYVTSMENCLGIFYPTMSTTLFNVSTDEYWQKGAMHRPAFAKAELEWRNSRNRSGDI